MTHPQVGVVPSTKVQRKSLNMIHRHVIFFSSMYCFVLFLASFKFYQKIVDHRASARRREDPFRIDTFPHGNHIRRGRSSIGFGRAARSIHKSRRWTGICLRSSATSRKFGNGRRNFRQRKSRRIFKSCRPTAQPGRFGGPFRSVGPEIDGRRLVHYQNVGLWFIFGKYSVSSWISYLMMVVGKRFIWLKGWCETR